MILFLLELFCNQYELNLTKIVYNQQQNLCEILIISIKLETFVLSLSMKMNSSDRNNWNETLRAVASV